MRPGPGRLRRRIQNAAEERARSDADQDHGEKESEHRTESPSRIRGGGTRGSPCPMAAKPDRARAGAVSRRPGTLGSGILDSGFGGSGVHGSACSIAFPATRGVSPVVPQTSSAESRIPNPESRVPHARSRGYLSAQARHRLQTTATCCVPCSPIAGTSAKSVSRRRPQRHPCSPRTASQFASRPCRDRAERDSGSAASGSRP